MGISRCWPLRWRGGEGEKLNASPIERLPAISTLRGTSGIFRSQGAGSPMAKADKPHHVYLIDGSGYIFRAFHALPPMTRPDGTPVNAVYGFTNMLAKLLKEHVGTHIAVIFDAGRLTF